MKGKASKEQVSRDETEAPAATERQRYLVGFPPAPSHRARTRLSSKNQITLPVSIVRQLGLKPGDEIDMSVWGDELIMHRRPQTAEEWIARFSGRIHVPGWETQEKIDTYVREERDSWNREGDDF